MYWLIAIAFIVVIIIAREFVITLPDAISEFKKWKGITFDTFGRLLLAVVILFFMCLCIYFMWLYADGIIDLAKGIDDHVKHLPDLC